MQRGFVRSLLDLSFTSFVTTRLMKVLYVLRLMLMIGTYLAVALPTFAVGGSSLGMLWLFVFGPLVLIAQAISIRVTCELVLVLFRIFENTRDQVALTRAAATGEGPASG